MCVFGAPIWWCLHRVHLRGWGASVCAGALAPIVSLAIGSILLGGLSSAAFEVAGFLQSGYVWIIPLSGAMGLTVWAVAYRRPAPQPSADTAR